MVNDCFSQDELVRRHPSKILIVDILEKIGEEKPVDQTSLGIAVGLERKQVNRILGELESVGVINRAGGNDRNGYCYRVNKEAARDMDCYPDLAAVGIFN